MSTANLTEDIEAKINEIVTAPDSASNPKVKARSVAKEPYFLRKDPTICIAGMESGWPIEYLGSIPVRALSEVPRQFQVDLPALVSVHSTGDIQVDFAIAVLMREGLTTQNHQSLLGFKQWTGQPWCPLFLEWEATYFHVPFDKWSVDLQSSAVGGNHAQVRYGDQRTVAGRIMMLPQPVFNLGAIVAQVLDAPSPSLSPSLLSFRSSYIGILLLSGLRPICLVSPLNPK